MLPVSRRILSLALLVAFLVLFVGFLTPSAPSFMVMDDWLSSRPPVLASTPRMHHLIPVNRNSAGPGFCKTLLSSLVHGYSPVILNWETDGDASHMQSMKVLGVHDFIAHNLSTDNDNDIVFMMDAFDIWLQQPPDVLVRRFEELNHTIVIGADKACWPNEWAEPSCQDVPESPVPKGAFGGEDNAEEGNGWPNTRPRWANSGTIIGYVAALRTLYVDLAHEVQSSDLVTEQGIFNDLLLRRSLTVDYWFRLFWATAFDTESGIIMNSRYPPDVVGVGDSHIIPYHLVPALVHHKRTGEVPVAVHFNDYLHKSMMREWWGLLWWNKPQEDFQRIVRAQLEKEYVTFAHNGSTATWGSLCGTVNLD